MVGDQTLTGAAGGVVLPGFTWGLVGICTTEKSQKGEDRSREVD